MHYAFLSVLIALSAYDILRGSLSFAPMALLYVFLKLQADRATDILFKRGLSRPVSECSASAREPEMESWIPPKENDPFASPLKEPLRLAHPEQETKSKQEANHEQASNKRSPSHEQEAGKAGAKASSKKPLPQTERKKPPYRAPKFHGAPHEVLGVDPDANTNLIKKAFRHWIKEFHPDHLRPGQETQCATERARNLNHAKESLLDRRRQMRKAA